MGLTSLLVALAGSLDECLETRPIKKYERLHLHPGSLLLYELGGLLVYGALGDLERPHLMIAFGNELITMYIISIGREEISSVDNIKLQTLILGM